MTTLYFVLFLIALGYLVVLLARFGNNISVYYYLMSFCVILVTFGAWQGSVAGSLAEALASNRTSYLGSSFVSFFMICCIAQLTKTKIPATIMGIGIGLSAVVAALGMTMGYSDIYYKSVQLAQIGGFSYLVKEYAPSHGLFILQLILSMGYGLSMIAVAFTQQKKVSYITSICSLLAMLGVIAVYFLKTGPYSFLPLAYDVGFAVLILLMNRVYLYNTEGLSQEEMKESQQYGLVTFDTKRRFLDADAAARKWFPELNNLKVDHTVTDCGTEFLAQVKQWITEKDEEHTRLFTCGDQIIKARCNVVILPAKRRVFCIRLQDDTRQQAYTRLVEHYNQDLEKNIALKTKQIKKIQDDITLGMASIVENRDSNTGGHIRRTSDVVQIYVRSLMESGILTESDEHFADCVIRAAPLHDFGKIAIADAILNKPGKFTPEEYEVMKKHPVHGATIVEQILRNSEDAAFKAIAKNVAHYHHEKWDGTGYPAGLKGDAIPLEARIMAMADVFDALVSKRVYKEKYSFDRAFAIIEESGGSHFDPVLCGQFLKCRNQLIALYMSYADE